MYENIGAWEENVPADLIPAITHLRKKFGDAHWSYGQVTEKFCYWGLHPGSADDEVKEYLKPLEQLKGIRTIFREAFERSGLPYFHPHSLRKTLVTLGQTACKSPEEYKAWSQNLGHEKVLTTFMSYGAVAKDRQAEILRGLAVPQKATQTGADQIAEAVYRLRSNVPFLMERRTLGCTLRRAWLLLDAPGRRKTKTLAFARVCVAS